MAEKLILKCLARMFMNDLKAKDEKKVAPAPVKKVSPETTRITVLTADRPMAKTFSLENGEIKVESYPQTKYYSSEERQIESLASLMQLVKLVKPTQCIIRGVAGKKLPYTLRNLETFPEPEEGCHWVMLDIDGMKLPAGIDSQSRKAIDFVTDKLPKPFQEASYGYQFSSSMGILNPEGTPRKEGISIHLLFWLNRPVPGKVLGAYLKLHCLQSGLYEFKDGNSINWGLDMATVVNAVQPLYVAPPIIKEGVRCKLREVDRVGIIKGKFDSVRLPELSQETIRQASHAQRAITAERARKLGLKMRLAQTMTESGVAIHRYYASPTDVQSPVQFGRALSDVVIREDKNSVILHLDGEKSPGSWFVTRRTPTIAYRFGDYANAPLRELSSEAYEYIRDELKWFIDVRTTELKLDADGRLPAFNSFLKSRIALVLAPTGTGKTQQTIAFIARDVPIGSLVIYVAPRIVLLDQMKRDLEAAGLTFQMYRDIKKDERVTERVLLTTAHSLLRMLDVAAKSRRKIVLIFDEIHMSLDEVMKTRRRLEMLERAISGAERAIFMTGTMTDLQIKTLTEICHHAVPGLGPDDYATYIFEPVKKHPLKLMRSEFFGGDIIELLREMKGLQDAGKQLPRTVIIQDTSRMESFRIMLNTYGLLDLADIVSRRESDDGEVDEAVTSTKPLLITTSLFSAGLNLVCPPERLWCNFSMIQVDRNAVVQTINRANRGNVACEVRIYHAGIGKKDKPFPRVVKESVESAFRDEASIGGLLEEYWQIDRATFRVLRNLEKNTSLALYELVEGDGFQNYALQSVGRVRKDKELSSEFQEYKKAARAVYDSRVFEISRQVPPASDGREYFDDLAAIERRRGTEELTPGEIEDLTFGVLVKLCDLEQSAHARALNIKKLGVLFGITPPWLSAQYDAGRIARITHDALVEKLEGVATVLEFLQAMQKEKVDESWLVSKLTRGRGLMKGFRDLEWGEVPYANLHQRFERIKRDMELARNRSKNHRAEVQGRVLTLLKELLESIGVRFGQKRGKDGRVRTDFSHPIVPATFNCVAMMTEIRAMAERYKALGGTAGSLEIPVVRGDEEDVGDRRSLEVCRDCVFRFRGFCMRGHPIDFWMEGGPHNVTSCAHHFRITQRQPATAATNLMDFVALQTAGAQ